MRRQRVASSGEVFNALPKCLQIPQWRTKQLCQRVTGIFAGLMDKPLWLKAAAQGSTDCERWVLVPLHDPEAYAICTHELSHNYFDSDPLAGEFFAKEYTKRLMNRFLATGSPIIAQPGFDKKLEALIDFLVNVFDDARVGYLWSCIYPGDGKVLRDRWMRITRERLHEASDDLFVYCFAVECGLTDEIDDAKPELIAIRPVLEDAFKQVQGTDFRGCLVVVRRTLDKILNVLLDMIDERQQDPNPFPSSSSLKTQKSQALAASALGDDKQDQADGDQGDDDDSKGKSDQQGQHSKPAPSDTDRRRGNMLGAVVAMGDPNKDLANGTERHGDVQPSKFQKRNKQALSRAHMLSNQALHVQTHDQDDYNHTLDIGAQDMQARIEQAQSMVQTMTTDDWLTKESRCRVKFVTPGEDDLGDTVDLDHEELAAAGMMKTEFIKILGRKNSALDDAGDEIDIQAVIDRKLDRSITEVFECEDPAPGFYVLLLADMSGSMNNAKFVAVEKAERMLRIGMDFPFVDIERWGFTQKEKGELLLFRFDPRNANSAAGMEGAWGTTPLHEALRVSGRQCAMQNKVRRLFVLTDGHPMYIDRRGESVGTDRLLHQCHYIIAESRHNNVGVFGLAIGTSLDDKAMTKMFGGPRYWRRAGGVGETTKAIVALAREQFIDYLRTKH